MLMEQLFYTIVLFFRSPPSWSDCFLTLSIVFARSFYSAGNEMLAQGRQQDDRKNPCCQEEIAEVLVRESKVEILIHEKQTFRKSTLCAMSDSGLEHGDKSDGSPHKRTTPYPSITQFRTVIP